MKEFTFVNTGKLCTLPPLPMNLLPHRTISTLSEFPQAQQKRFTVVYAIQPAKKNFRGFFVLPALKNGPVGE